METLEKSIIISLDGNNDDLFPYLPYLLQDLWEIGSNPDVIINLLQKQQFAPDPHFHVLDLGCGKGAISVRLAHKFGFQIHGIDGMPAFIAEGQQQAQKYQVSEHCQFEVGDIRQQVKKLKNYDLIILGSIGPVLGDVETTLQQVKLCLKPTGYIILDDGYVPDANQANAPHYPTRTAVLTQIQRAGLKIVAEYYNERSDIVESDTYIFKKIKQRAEELKQQHPEKADLFDAYVKAQAEENSILENQIKCVTWLLQRIE